MYLIYANNITNI